MEYNVIYASCKGQKEDHPYQDFIQLSETDRFLLAALADGLGSSRFSSRGACMICQVINEQFANDVEKGCSVQDILTSAIDEWYQRLAIKGVSHKDCLTTSSVLFVDKIACKAYFAHIGDSLISYRVKGEPVVCLSEEKDFLNETNCIGTSTPPYYFIAEVDISNGIDFLVASDGFGDELIADRMGDLFDYFKTKYSPIRADKRNKALKIELVETIQNKNNDDKSLIFGWIQ